MTPKAKAALKKHYAKLRRITEKTRSEDFDAAKDLLYAMADMNREMRSLGYIHNGEDGSDGEWIKVV